LHVPFYRTSLGGASYSGELIPYILEVPSYADVELCVINRVLTSSFRITNIRDVKALLIVLKGTLQNKRS